MRRVSQEKTTPLLKTKDDLSKKPDETSRNEAKGTTTSDTTEAKVLPHILPHEKHDQEKSESRLGGAHAAESKVTCDEGYAASAVGSETALVNRLPSPLDTPLNSQTLSNKIYCPTSSGYSTDSPGFFQGDKPKCKSILEDVIPSHRTIRKACRVPGNSKIDERTVETQNVSTSGSRFGADASMKGQSKLDLVAISNDVSFPKAKQVGPVTPSLDFLDAATSNKARLGKINLSEEKAPRSADKLFTYTGQANGNTAIQCEAMPLKNGIAEKQGIEKSLKQNNNGMDCKKDSFFEQRILASKESQPEWVKEARAKTDSGITLSTSKKDDVSISLDTIAIKTCGEKSEKVKSSDVCEENTSAFVEEERKAGQQVGEFFEESKSYEEEWPSYNERVSIIEPLTNLGPYQDDVENIMLSRLSSKIGLAYYRNPFSLLDVSPASPADTVVGVSDQFQSVFVRFRVVPQGKGKLMTSDGNIIYIGDFKDGE